MQTKGSLTEGRPKSCEDEELQGWKICLPNPALRQRRFMQPGKGVNKKDPELLQPAEELLLTPFAPRLVVSAAVRCGAHARALQFLEEDLIDQVPLLKYTGEYII